MKVRATVVLTFQAKTLADAGSVLDEVLGPARARDDVDVGAVEIVTPPGEHIVTLPPAPSPAGFARPTPPATGDGHAAQPSRAEPNGALNARHQMTTL